ncbi:ATP-binding cassette domain-containing protein [Rathayibacter sp. VKM Ac-2804]|uniref:ABC transporter ATP-binding protein n=1 Tax=Rathayibacter sp. VKM Ac-2804 TaxID=2609257 RepID=UPI00132EC834|nr:ABC transporter ATP-binding protein [Rathayibacter sp. VKM Ac-2804]QHF24553.1 ATP-binding cassette domain-containing protein [Rathayibacter sp. VKM Ac-2804]
MTSHTTSAAITIDHLSKQYPGAPGPAVDDISLDVAAGEFITLLGPSGSGKSTTLSIVAGFETATAGRVEIGGQDVLSIPSHKRGLGMVFQNYALFPHLTAAENVAFPLRERRWSKEDTTREVGRMLEVVGLAGLGRRYPRELSGGQQQRVALARALVFGPPALLMDEPLGALDKKLREQLQVEIARIHRETGTTVLFVTHDQEEALALSDRIAVYENGRIAQCGTPDELYERPATIFVARFVGDSNILFHDGAHPRLEQGRRPQASVLVRPERIQVTGRDSAPVNTNALHAKVTDVVYQGAFRKVGFRTDDGFTGTAREARGAYSPFHSGDAVAVCWSAEDQVELAS